MFNFTVCFIEIPGRISVGGYAVDSQNKVMLENGRGKYLGVYRGTVLSVFCCIN
jgi:hypothetical protein